MAWLFMAGAIVSELAGTLGLRAVAAGPRWWTVSLIVAAYAISFTCLGAALRQLNVAVVYATWSAVGMAAVSLAGVLLFDERLNGRAVAGLVVIVLGVAMLVGSGSVRHA